MGEYSNKEKKSQKKYKKSRKRYKVLKLTNSVSVRGIRPRFSRKILILGFCSCYFFYFQFVQPLKILILEFCSYCTFCNLLYTFVLCILGVLLRQFVFCSYYFLFPFCSAAFVVGRILFMYFFLPFLYSVVYFCTLYFARTSLTFCIVFILFFVPCTFFKIISVRFKIWNPQPFLYSLYIILYLPQFLIPSDAINLYDFELNVNHSNDTTSL